MAGAVGAHVGVDGRVDVGRALLATLVAALVLGVLRLDGAHLVAARHCSRAAPRNKEKRKRGRRRKRKKKEEHKRRRRRGGRAQSADKMKY